MRRGVVFYVICPVLISIISPLTYAEIASVDATLHILSAWYNYDTPTSPVSSYSYSQVGTSSNSDSDEGSIDPYGIGWLAQSESSVQTQQGTAYTVSGDDPYIAVAAGGNASLSLNESINASSSTMVFNNYRATNNGNVNFCFGYYYDISTPSQIQAKITYSLAVWEWSGQTAQLILTPMTGWAIASLTTPKGAFSVIEKTFSAGAGNWDNVVDSSCIALQANMNYTYFLSVQTELTPVPEPTSLLLLTLGGVSLIMKRRL